GNGSYVGKCVANPNLVDAECARRENLDTGDDARVYIAFDRAGQGLGSAGCRVQVQRKLIRSCREVSPNHQEGCLSDGGRNSTGKLAGSAACFQSPVIVVATARFADENI